MSKIGQLYRHLPSNIVYSVTGVEQFNYGFYSNDTYTMSPWVDSNAQLDMNCSNLETIEWLYVYDLQNTQVCSHDLKTYIGISGGGYYACVMCDEKL